MTKRTLTPAVVAACVMGMLSSVSQAGAPGGPGPSVLQQALEILGSILDPIGSNLVCPPGPIPPPK